MRVEDLRDRRFGKLVVKERTKNMRGGQARWVCRCDCGQLSSVSADNLKRGRQVSCGCHRRAIAGTQTRTHGLSKTSEYAIWSSAKDRCGNPNDRAYKHYGGRGIRVCPAWRDSFETFLRDMGKRPRGGTLDRIDNDGPYSPENCRWATRTQQANNTRTNRIVTYGGFTLTLMQWAARTGIDVHTLGYRLRAGWPLEDAFRNGAWSHAEPHLRGNKRHRWAYARKT